MKLKANTVCGSACICIDAIGGSSRIAGGTQAIRGEFLFVVSITQNDSHICGGFIYNDLWIVTAASCVFEYTNIFSEIYKNASELQRLIRFQCGDERY